MAIEVGARLREERTRRRLTLEALASRAGVGRGTVHRIEMGQPASLESYARLAAALTVRPELTLQDARRPAASQNQDEVHAAMGELEARQLRGATRRVAIDEPYQHFQFAGRVDLVAWSIEERALLLLENRTRFPNLQEAAGSYNAKRAYFPPAFAERLGLRRGWRSVAHVMVALWSAEVLHTLRLRRSSFEALCPDPPDAFNSWWSGEEIAGGTTSSLVLLDPAAELGRRRRFVGLVAVERVEPRCRDYASAAAVVSRHFPIIRKP